MKFNRILMNPPYERNLHLKILENVIGLLDNNKSSCVNLSPIRWLQDPVADLKKTSDYIKFENSILKNLSDLVTVTSKKASDYFGIIFNMDLGIYYISEKKGFNYSKIKYIFNNNDYESIINKVLKYSSTFLKDVCDKEKIDGIRVRVNELQPLEVNDGRDEKSNNWRKWIINPHTETYIYENGFTKSGKHWSSLMQKGKYSKDEDSAIPFSIKFDSWEEAENFEKSCKTLFMNICKVSIQRDMHVPLAFIPYMGNEINPRTGLKGYKSEWTDEDFYQFYKIDSNERSIIENEMNKYID